MRAASFVCRKRDSHYNWSVFHLYVVYPLPWRRNELKRHSPAASYGWRLDALSCFDINEKKLYGIECDSTSASNSDETVMVWDKLAWDAALALACVEGTGVRLIWVWSLGLLRHWVECMFNGSLVLSGSIGKLCYFINSLYWDLYKYLTKYQTTTYRI